MSNNPVCFVFGAGDPPCEPPHVGENDLVIAADAGVLYTRSHGICTDVLIGDFDSLGRPPAGLEGVTIRHLPAEKDDTDTLAALRYGLERGYKIFRVYGGTGGARFDHTIANIQCLGFLVSNDAQGYLYAENWTATAFRGVMRLDARESGYVSVFALGGPAEGVYLRGLKYPLTNARLTPDFPLGVSNEFIGEAAEVRSASGVLLVICPTGVI